jgi:hypothetical protein
MTLSASEWALSVNLIYTMIYVMIVVMLMMSRIPRPASCAPAGSTISPAGVPEGGR